MDKIAENLKQYIPHAALAGIAGLGLYGGYQALKPEETMWEKAKRYGSEFGNAVLPSIADASSDLANTFINNPQMMNALAMQAQGGMNPNMQMNQPEMNQQATFQPQMEQTTMPMNQMNFSELESLQNQLRDMSPYSAY